MLIWNYKEKIFDKKRNKVTDGMMRHILTHANPEWREQRSTCARSLDPKNQDRMKKEESWCGAYELGQSDGEMEWLPKMVVKFLKVGKRLVKTGEELCEKDTEKRRGQKGKGMSSDCQRGCSM